jgi:uncharacterized protein (DUF1501 family)
MNPPAVATNAEALLAQRAEQVESDRYAQDERWGQSGWTRRRFLAGLGMVGVAALGSQLVTTRVAYAAPGVSNGNTLVTVFLRGAADGLRILVPAGSQLGGDYLRSVRGPLVPADAALLSLDGAPGWALNSALAPLRPFWASKELAFVPAVSATGVSRSHFQAQQFLERGGSDTLSTGWLDRTLQQLGPGTTFRAVSQGSAQPPSLSGAQSKLAMDSLKSFSFPGWSGVTASSEAAITALYRGVGGSLGADVPTTLAALSSAEIARSKFSAVGNGAHYPSGHFGSAMADLATMLRAELGLQVATVDVGGWDTHTNEAGDLDAQLSSAATVLSAFLTDLGPVRRRRVTIVVMTEFGRRVAMNDSGGSDHGHGSLMWLLGGGLAGGQVHGRWDSLSDQVLDDGDVPGLNNAFDVLGELASRRLGVAALGPVFPGHLMSPVGVTAGA